MSNDADKRVLVIAERGLRTPGMLTSHEVALLSAAFLRNAGKIPEALPSSKQPKKRGRPPKNKAK